MAKLDFSNRITKSLSDNFTLKPTANEFQLFILAFGVLKYAAMAVSIASGFAFFYYKLADMISGFPYADIVAASLAVLLLMCLELITNTSLSKGFKMLFKGRIRAGLGCMFIAVCFFFVSFNISCIGIFLAVSDTHKVESNISAKYEADKQAVRESTAQMVKAYEADIAAIQPPSWNNYNLTTPQLEMRHDLRNKIDSCYRAEQMKLALIATAENQELTANKETATSSAEDYRFYVAIILILELLSNGILQFYSKKILHETDKAIEIDEFIDAYVDESREELGSLIESSLGAEKALYMAKIKSKSDEERDKANRHQEPPRKAATAAKPVITGFSITSDAPEEANASSENGNQEQPPAEPKQAPPAPTVCKCVLCGADFVMKTTWQKFCCVEHRLQYNANKYGHGVHGVAPDYVTWPDVGPGSAGR